MATITIGSVTYTVYSDVSDADDYFNGSSQFSDWDALTTAEKQRGLVSSTRLLERQTWQGSKTSSSQDLAWPRTGVTDRDGEAVDSATIPAEIIEASQLLALDIALGQSVESSTTTEDLNKRIKAGSVEIEKFRADKETITRFPLDVTELLSPFLSSNVSVAGSLSFGTDGEALDDIFDFSGGF